jgi:hypothetical protein
MAECTYQFSCPSCSALLQAVLKQALTSVQCGECFDVFDVQMPSAYAAALARASTPRSARPRDPPPGRAPPPGAQSAPPLPRRAASQQHTGGER